MISAGMYHHIVRTVRNSVQKKRCKEFFFVYKFSELEIQMSDIWSQIV